MNLQAAAAQAFSAFVSKLGTDVPSAPDRVADLIAHHLAATRIEALPPAAQDVWRDVVRLLKADVRRTPLQEKAIAAIRSWPAARVTELIDALRRIASALDDAENDRQNDEIRVHVARAYL
jgi:hypothetical protein